MVTDRDLEDPRLDDLPIDEPDADAKYEDELEAGDAAYDDWNENVRWEV